MPLNDFRAQYVNDTISNIVNIGIINADFQQINYVEENEEDGALHKTDDVFEQINNGKPIFLKRHAFVVSPLKKYVRGNDITFVFNSSFLLQNTETKDVLNIIANFETPVDYTIYDNGTFPNPSITIPYSEEGYKILTFIATFADGTSKTTQGTLHVKLSNNLPPPPLVVDGVIDATIPFQGLDENSGYLGHLEYRVFYGNPQGKMLKPIVIIDGFDPGDERKIEDRDSNEPAGEHYSIWDRTIYEIPGNNEPVYLIPILKGLGYDVVVVNHPTYWRGQKKIDGGADFIQRNAYAHIELYKWLNAQLATNNSSEQLVIIGPSMGGQISRFALAYMEGHNIPHNTRLWVSVDSPHLGANIPLGLQTLVRQAWPDSAEAQIFNSEKLGSPAAKQQLIEQLESWENDQIRQTFLNGRTYSQGFNQDHGHPYFIQYYDELYNNGLYNSRGYPQNLRKIAMVNGSLKGVLDFDVQFSPQNGRFVNDNQITVNVRGFQHVCQPWPFQNNCFDVHIASLETFNLPSFNGYGKVSRYKKSFADDSKYVNNYNSRGDMDNVPGGYFDGFMKVAGPLDGTDPIVWQGGFYEYWEDHILLDEISDRLGGAELNVYTNEQVHSFIPTISSLGFHNPKMNWTQNLNRDLTCTDEIPFNSYFGPRLNESHTSFTQASVTWLLEEIAGNPQPPTVYLDGNDLDGPTKVCYGTTATYSFPPCGSTPVQSWEYSNNLLNLVSSNSSSIVVQPKNSSSSGLGYVKAIYPYQTVQKNIWIGKPNFSFDMEWDDAAKRLHITMIGPSGSDIALQGITNVSWQKVPNSGSGTMQGCSGFDCHTRGPLNNTWTVTIKVTATNSCGTTIEYITATPPPPLASKETGSYDFVSNPNSIYTINFVDANVSIPVENFENPQPDFKITAFDFTGNPVMETTEKPIDISRLKSGIYILKAMIDDNVLTKKVIR